MGSFLVAACFFVNLWLLNKGVGYSVDCSFYVFMLPDDWKKLGAFLFEGRDLTYLKK